MHSILMDLESRENMKRGYYEVTGNVALNLMKLSSPIRIFYLVRIGLIDL